MQPRDYICMYTRTYVSKLRTQGTLKRQGAWPSGWSAVGGGVDVSAVGASAGHAI